VSVEWDDIALENLFNDPEGPVGRDLERRAIEAEAAAKRLLSQHGTGRIYRKNHPHRIHQASAPGEPPAPDLGHLRASVGHEVGVDATGLYGAWGILGVAARTKEDRGGDDANLAEIGAWLEYGTRYMDPRPWLRPSIPAAGGDSEI